MSDSSFPIGIRASSSEKLSSRAEEKPIAWKSLSGEMLLVTLAVILLIQFSVTAFTSRSNWFIAPTVLIAAALIPTAIRKSTFTGFRIVRSRIRYIAVILCYTCLFVFPPTLLGFWFLRSHGLDVPLAPVAPPASQWVGWLFYQFMYVSVSEEVFFRGYLLNNIKKAASAVFPDRSTVQWWVAILISAVCFAVAHIVVQGQIISVLTFFPGLILGWLFFRTKSLYAPIIFHGLANTLYCMAAALC